MTICAIWTDQHNIMGTGLATVATLVFSGIVIITLNNTLGERLSSDNQEIRPTVLPRPGLMEGGNKRPPPSGVSPPSS